MDIKTALNRLAARQDLTGEEMRSVMTIIYYADGTTVGETNHPARDLDLALWLGNAKPGSPADSAANPLLWHRSWND